MNKRQRVKVNKMTGKQGQILVLVLLIVVVSLAVGLAVAARNLTNIRTSTQTEHSQRAFTAAEGGVESTLSNLNNVASYIKDGSNPPPSCTRVPGESATCSLPSSVTGSGVNASTSNVVVKGNKSYEKTIELGDVAQVDIHSYQGNTIIEWAKTGEPADVILEFTILCDIDPGACPVQVDDPPVIQAQGADYKQLRVGFKAVNASSSGLGTGFRTCEPNAGSLFSCKTEISLPDAKPLLLRIKPFRNRVTVKITPSDLSAFPVQTYEITSTATTDTGLTRKVQVTREALPQMPAIFDYVLYSGQDIIK